MKPLRIAAALAAAMFACTAGSVLAQDDEGKTEAAKLASESQAALQKLTASVPLAAQLTKTRGGRSGLSHDHQGGPRRSADSPARARS